MDHDGSLPTGTVTILFTDLENSTRLWEQFPDEMRPAMARHDELMQAAIKNHNGRIVKTTGDGLHAVFDSPADAIAAALAGQQTAVAEAWPIFCGEKASSQRQRPIIVKRFWPGKSRGTYLPWRTNWSALPSWPLLRTNMSTQPKYWERQRKPASN